MPASADTPLAGPRLAGAPAVSPAQELSLSSAAFERVRRLIYGHAGIHLQENKQAMVHSRLSRRLRELGLSGFDDYLDRLERAGAGAPEWQQFVNCLTTNLTSFFREAHHFDLLREHLTARRGVQRIWCCAASTGEEPYSLAMTVAEALGPGAGIRILATDIDTAVLATAQAGVYASDARGLDEGRLRRHFMRGRGAQEGRIRVKPDLAAMVEFRPFNLMETRWSFGEPFDVVFCRNVMIYFDAATQQRVLQQLHGVLRPGGLLFVGHSENFSDARSLFRLRGKTVYDRV